MKLTQQNILITGGAGFIGSNLIERFIGQDNHVICLDNFSTGSRGNISSFLDKENFRLIEGDIRDLDTCKEACKDADIILHQAALGSVPRSIKDPITTNSVNISGFLNMLVAAKEMKVNRMVYAASSSTYGDSTILPKEEDKIGNPLSPYAVTKYVNELYAKVYGDLHGLELIGLRYFNVFGRRQTPEGAYAAAIPKFISSFINLQSPVIHGDGTQTRDFTYIDNVIQANELAATTKNKDALNQVYNVACGEETVLNDLLSILQVLLSKFNPDINEVEINYGPERIGDVRFSLASIEKAKRYLGYHPTHSVKQGLEEAIDWYWDNLS